MAKKMAQDVVKSEPVRIADVIETTNEDGSKTISLSIPDSPYRYMKVTIKGTSDLLLNKMTDEARKELVRKQTTSEEASTGSKSGKKALKPINKYGRAIETVHWLYDDLSPVLSKKDIERGKDYTEKMWKDAFYAGLGNENDRGNTNIGYDAGGIKKGMLEAVVRVLGQSKSTIENANLHIVPTVKNLVPIYYNDVQIQEDVIPQFKGTFVTYRNVFHDWNMDLTISFNPQNITDAKILEIIQAMGFSGGLGARRVGLKGGTNGTFRIVEAQDVTDYIVSNGMNYVGTRR